MRFSDFHTRERKQIVRINVYDLVKQNEYLYPLGMGAYHTGVEIGDVGMLQAKLSKTQKVTYNRV